MATVWTSTQLSQPVWGTDIGTSTQWSAYPPLFTAEGVGFGEGGFGEGGYGSRAFSQTGLSQPIWTPWTTD